MSFTKFATLESAEVLGIKGSQDQIRTATLDKFSEFNDYRTEDGYLYARIRAISSRVNKNHDGWPSVELAGGQDVFDHHIAGGGVCPTCKGSGEVNGDYCKRCNGEGRVSSKVSFTVEADKNAEYGYSTFLGKPIFVDHNNHDPSRARGVVVDAKLHVEDHRTASDLDSYYSAAPDNHLPPTWVELLLEVDAKSFPKLAASIIEGSKDANTGIDGFSMGCDVEKSVCNICKNAATSPDDYCEHVRLKGAHFDYIDPKTHKKSSRKSYEDCYGIKFFEISAVFDPADETALLRELIQREGKTAEAPESCPECGGSGHDIENPGYACRNCGGTGQHPLEEFNPGLLAPHTPEGVPEYMPGGPTNQTREIGPAETEYEMNRFRRHLDQADETQHPLRWGKTATTHTAENPLPQSDMLHAPEEVDTLRNETVCPVCGSTMDDETCEICGYIEPPEGFKNPDVQKHQQEEGLEDPGFDPTPRQDEQMPPEAQGGIGQPDLLEGNNPQPTAKVKAEASRWRATVDPRIAARINVTEQPIKTTQGEQTNEPDETIVQDETKPVTSSVRTTEEFLQAAGRGKENQMSDTQQRVAAEPSDPAASPDKKTEVEGVGGVIEPSNEEASKADKQVNVLDKGGTGVESVSADKENENVAQGDEHSKNIEEIHTQTWSDGKGDSLGQHDPVSDTSYPSEEGQGAGKWSAFAVTAYDSAPYPSEDGGLAGGTAVKGVQPADPVGNAEDRVDVLQPTTTPDNNSGPTDTWSGTGGNKVLRQQDPVTRETLEGEDLVDLSPSKSSSHIFSAVRLADLEIEVGLTEPEEKYERMAELEAKSPEVVQASLEYVEKIKDKVASRRQHQAKVTRRLPSFNGGMVPNTASNGNGPDGEVDESLFL